MIASFSEAFSTDLKAGDLGNLRILAVGSLAEWQRKIDVPRESDSLHFVEFSDLNQELLDNYSPDVVVSPALGWDFDCIDMALKLEAIGYSGPYRAIAQDIPKPELIQSEIKQLCPKIDFGLLKSY
jgi:hypothetical protein